MEAKKQIRGRGPILKRAFECELDLCMRGGATKPICFFFSRFFPDFVFSSIYNSRQDINDAEDMGANLPVPDWFVGASKLWWKNPHAVMEVERDAENLSGDEPAISAPSSSSSAAALPTWKRNKKGFEAFYKDCRYKKMFFFRKRKMYVTIFLSIV